MKIRDGQQEDYDTYVANNVDGIGPAVVAYAERWADHMESRMAEGQALVDIWKDSQHASNTEGVTGIMQAYAAKSLTWYWEHGEEFTPYCDTLFASTA